MARPLKTDYTYNTDRQLHTITQAKNTAVEMVTENVYDPFTKKLTAIKKNGNTITSFTYDAIGRVETVTDATNMTITYGYDNLNRITKIIYPDSKFEDFNYSIWSPFLLVRRVERNGQERTYKYDVSKRLVEESSPKGAIRYQYDLDGNMIALIDTDQKETKFEFDLNNRLNKRIFPNSKSISYEYDNAGLLMKFINSRNIQTIYTYDANHNLKTVDYSDTTPDVTFDYDDYNRLVTMTDGIGTYSHTYYADSKLQTIDGPWADDTITYSYNALGQLSSMTPQGGQAVSYAYDTMGRLTDIQTGVDTFTYSYSGINSLVQSLTRPNGSVTTYDYNDALMRLTDITNKDSALQTINGNSFTYNDNDLIDTETIINASAITPPTSGVTVYTNNNVNQLTSTTNPSQSFIYDDDGNMITGYTPAGYQFTASYDAENRLIFLFYNDGSTDHETKYFYSGNNLLAKTEKYEDTVKVDETRFIRAEFLTLQERSENNLVMREYLWGIDKGGGIGGLLRLKENSQDYYYLYDGKGNVSALTNDIDQVVASYRYDEFGNVIAQTGTFNQPYKFSTKRYDSDTGLSYYGYRFYMPSVGKWLTRDPIGERGAMNLFEFVGNNSMNFVDIYGLDFLDILPFVDSIRDAIKANEEEADAWEDVINNIEDPNIPLCVIDEAQKTREGKIEKYKDLVDKAKEMPGTTTGGFPKSRIRYPR